MKKEAMNMTHAMGEAEIAWFSALNFSAVVLGGFMRDERSLDHDSCIRLAEAIEGLAGVRRYKGPELVLRVWTLFLQAYGRGAAMPGATAHGDLALATAELMCGPLDLGAARPAYAHLLRRQVRALDRPGVPGDRLLTAADPRFGRWIRQINGDRRKRTPPGAAPVVGILAPHPTDQVPSRPVAPEWNRLSPEYRACDLGLRQARKEWAAFRASAIAPRECAVPVEPRARETGTRRPARYTVPSPYLPEEQCLGNFSDHWSMRTSHHG